MTCIGAFGKSFIISDEIRYETAICSTMFTLFKGKQIQFRQRSLRPSMRRFGEDQRQRKWHLDRGQGSESGYTWRHCRGRASARGSVEIKVSQEVISSSCSLSMEFYIGLTPSLCHACVSGQYNYSKSSKSSFAYCCKMIMFIWDRCVSS